MRRSRHSLLIIPLLNVFGPAFCITWGGSSTTPEASSTLLSLHKLYLQQPPHDRTLYDRLHVSPNATAATIRKQYRELSRKYHPDKQRGGGESTAASLQLERVRQAYEILKDDRSRLPYHRYGLLDIRQAVILLTGQNHDQDPSLQALLQMMGYPRMSHGQQAGAFVDSSYDYSDHSPPLPLSKHDRIRLVAALLLERMRPFVEGRINAQALADVVAGECDNLKRLPLGASILRCIGRAYRHEGSRFLKRQRLNRGRSRLLSDVSDVVQGHWRHVKHVATAAVASGRCVLAEQHHKLQYNHQIQQQQAAQAVMYHYDGEFGQVVGEDALPSDEELRVQEQLKAQRVLLESLQIEALWKVSKLELDQIVRDACQLILSGEYFFVPPSHQHAGYPPSDGWVGSAGIAIDASLGRVRVAQALSLMGEVMVSRSKQGTAWMQ